MVTWPLNDVIEHERRIAAQQNLGAGVSPQTGHITNGSAEGTEVIAPANGERNACLSWVVPGPPVPAPRMSQRDKWLRPPRPCVAAYWAYRDRLRRVAGHPPIPIELSIIFRVPMPPSWTAAKRARMDGAFCRSKPDLKNLICGVEDAIWKQDSAICAYGRMVKYWTSGPGETAITITP